MNTSYRYIVFIDRAPLGEGVVLSEGLLLSEGVVLSETGKPGATASNEMNLVGEP